MTVKTGFFSFFMRRKVKTVIPVVYHELLHTQQGVVADELVLVVHVIHHQLFSTQLLNNPEIRGGRNQSINQSILVSKEHRQHSHA